MAETLTSPTPADLAFAIDPNVTRDAFWDDDKFINFGKQSAESNQSYGQIGRDSTAGFFKIAATKDGAGAFEPIAVFTSDIERSRWSAAGELIHGVGEGGVVAATGNTLRAPDVVTGGAGNIAGADITVAAGIGTGTGDAGIVDFQLPIVALAGDIIQTRASRLTLDMVSSATVLTMAAAQAMSITTAAGDLTLNPVGDVDVQSNVSVFGTLNMNGNVLIGHTAAGGDLLLRATSSGTPGDIIAEVEPGVEAWRTLSGGEWALGTPTLFAATDIANLQKDTNGDVHVRCINETDGTASSASVSTKSSSGGTALFAVMKTFSPSFTTSGANKADSVQVLASGTANGMIFRATGAVPFEWWPNDAQKMTLLSTGELLLGATSATTEIMVVQQDQNAATLVRVRNDTDGTAAAVQVQCAINNVNASTTVFSDIHSSFPGEAQFRIGGADTTALVLHAVTAIPIIWRSNNIEEMRLLSGGTLAHGTGEGGVTAATGNTLRAPDIITGGAGNIAGADYTIAAGIGTGTGDAGIIDFQLPIIAAAGDFIQTRASRLTLDMVASTTVLTMAAAQAFTISTAAGDLTLSPTGDTKVTGSLAVSGELIHDFWQRNAQDTDPTVAGDRPAGPTAAAPAVADTVNAGLTVLRYDDTAEEIRSLGTRRIKASLLTLDIKALWRAQTAPGDTLHDIGWKIYWREIPDGGAAPSTTWAGTNDGSKTLTEIANIANDVLFHETTETLTLVSEGILLDREYEFAISRVAPAGTNLVGDWDVRRFTMTLKG